MNKAKLQRAVVTRLPRVLTDVLYSNHLEGNRKNIEYNDAILKKTHIKFVGNGNRIVIQPGARLTNCKFYIAGTDNTIIIGKDCRLTFAEFWTEESGNLIQIGDKATVSGKCHFAAIEGTKILVGEDCMFSSEIVVQTGDSHSIIQNDCRVNPSKDIIFGSHVWVGQRVTILKGSVIPHSSIIGAGALVTREFTKNGCIIAGVPAKVLKENITWKRERI